MAMISAAKQIRATLKKDINALPSGSEVLTNLEDELKQIKPNWRTYKPPMSDEERKRAREMTKIYILRAKSKKMKSIQNYFYKL